MPRSSPGGSWAQVELTDALCSQINNRMTEFVVSTKNHYKISFVKRIALENTPAPKTSNFLNNACQSRIEYIFLR